MLDKQQFSKRKNEENSNYGHGSPSDCHIDVIRLLQQRCERTRKVHSNSRKGTVTNEYIGTVMSDYSKHRVELSALMGNFSESRHQRHKRKT